MKPDCPFCSSHDCELVSQFGGQIITAQWRCRACGSYFEAVREDFDDARSPTVVDRQERAADLCRRARPVVALLLTLG